MLLGYARVSSDRDQTYRMQLEALQAAGAERIYREKLSGDARRPQQLRLLAEAQPGDSILVWKLDRWGRSLKDFIATTDSLAARGIGFRSLTEPIATEGSAGELMRQIIAAFAQYELNVIRERTRTGIRSAQAKGIHCGRPLRLTPEQVAWIREQLAKEDGPTVRQVAAWMGVSVPVIRHARDGTGPYTSGKPGRLKSGRWITTP